MAMDEDLRSINPLSLMLVAMLCDQIQALGIFYRKGMWREDPSELGEWLRLEGLSDRGNRDTFTKDAAMMEWRMWGGCTDVLVDVLARETVVRIDRGRIVKLAQAHGSVAMAAENGRIRSARHHRAAKKREGLGRVSVQRSNRVA